MNKVFLIGNLTRDPEGSQTKNETTYCEFTVAVNRTYVKEGQQDVDFIPVVTFAKTAENCLKYLKKGKKIAVSGALEITQYESADGGNRYFTQVIANEVEFLSPAEAKAEEPAKKPYRR